MEGSVAPNVGEVTSTGSQGYQPEMNLRSVFSAEQQRILQRYYDSGMTNQSKSCFQLILQCAQETKLDFSVVRTWVGNKRRKMSSKTYVETGGQLQGSVSNSPSRPQETTVRTMPNLSRSQQPPPRSSSGADLIMTCVYSPNNSSTRPGTTTQTSTPKADLLKPVLQRAPVRTEAEYHKLPAPVQRPAPVVKACMQLMEERTVGLPRPQNAANTTNSIYAAKKNYVGSGQMVERIAPQKTMTWPVKNVAEAPGGQRLHKAEQPNQSPLPHLSSGQRPRDSTCGLKNLEIREVFSLAPGEPSSRTLGAALEERPRVPETNCFSIAMETGDVNDEYAREEELASMAAQNQLCSRFRESNSSPRENRSALSPIPVRTGSAKALQPNSREAAENPPYHSDYYMSLNTSAHNTSGTQYPGHNAARSSGHRHYSIAAQPGGMVPNSNNYQISGNLTVPWITECSRKRTLQDRTQFSDHDLAMLKKYWDNGMTSLGSVCREKIEAVASELNVDCEIVRTWIGNRRRKYRLMGIEVPPPRGGPATFSEQLESASSLTPSEDPVAGVVEDNDRHDEVSICLSEESSQADDVHEVGRNEDLSIKEDSQDMAPPHNVKVEAPEEEMSDTMGKFDVEQMRSLLDYKNEDVRYMESELQRYKQKYTELQAFTRSLIHAVRTNDRDQQQVLLSEPPLDLEDMDFSHMSPDPDDTSYSISSMSEGTAQTSCERPDSDRKELMDFTKV